MATLWNTIRQQTVFNQYLLLLCSYFLNYVALCYYAAFSFLLFTLQWSCLFFECSHLEQICVYSVFSCFELAGISNEQGMCLPPPSIFQNKSITKRQISAMKQREKRKRHERCERVIHGVLCTMLMRGCRVDRRPRALCRCHEISCFTTFRWTSSPRMLLFCHHQWYIGGHDTFHFINCKMNIGLRRFVIKEIQAVHNHTDTEGKSTSWWNVWKISLVYLKSLIQSLCWGIWFHQIKSISGSVFQKTSMMSFDRNVFIRVFERGSAWKRN